MDKAPFANASPGAGQNPWGFRAPRRKDQGEPLLERLSSRQDGRGSSSVTAKSSRVVGSEGLGVLWQSGKRAAVTPVQRAAKGTKAAMPGAARAG
jgi:hypothetical protein